MHKFLRITTDANYIIYLNYDYISRIEIQHSLTQASIVTVDKHEPVVLRGENYAELIQVLGQDQDEA